MGACCCCASKRTEQCPRRLEDHESLSAHRSATFSMSTGLLVDTNLETPNPEAYTPPPSSPISPDSDRRPPQMPNADSAVGITSADSTERVEKDLKEKEGKPPSDLELASLKDLEVTLTESGKSILSAEEEEEVCPTCLEGYDKENPKILTKCEHHFHLSCILEWEERSDLCPMCDQVMVIDDAING
ncbi:hypothetical protein Nepgr_011226 [Nepenthes gracilis]|uniref:RING-type E3 ubiquitin transferase n=1 Tax=Nepenthes gracilis TaxID=150966 RepID=A0AAD3SEU7_NEPGR|nr:hypothetical protein Nepgr_011226 [Nepenthes gracilis]